MSFRENFVWGAATSSYQIEGAVTQDGRGPSVWDDFCQVPGAIRCDNVGDVACDHYNLYKIDVALMKQVGLKAYRFSIAWPRVFPTGTGKVNEKGLEFYSNLVDELLANGIEPYVTLYHWDYPSNLHHRGGWLHDQSPEWFEQYADVVTQRLGDRVKHWMTFNEPNIFVPFGYRTGSHAPGLKLPFQTALNVYKHVLLAHGLGVKVIRKNVKNSKVSVALAGEIPVPLTDSPADIEAARQEMFSAYEDEFRFPAWFSEPMLKGRYPEDAIKTHGPLLPVITDEEFKLINQPLDYLSLNLYSGNRFTADANGERIKLKFPMAHPKTSIRWSVLSEVMYWAPKFIWDAYQIPVAITENGLADVNWLDREGKVQDPNRIEFLSTYLGQLQRAAREGVDIVAYFMWSFLDNFEWAEGYEERFGLVHVDYDTMKRTPKSSFYWYKNVIKNNGV